MRRLFLIFTAVIGMSSEARADSSLEELAGRRGYDRAAIVRVETILARAGREGLEVEPLRDKAREGFAKRVPVEKLVRVLEEQLSVLSALARRVPLEMRTARVLEAALTAHRAGARPELVEELAGIQGIGPDAFEAALYGFGVLRTSGGRADDVGRFLVAQLEAGLAAAQIEQVTRVSGRALSLGLADTADLGAASSGQFRGDKLNRWLRQWSGLRGDSRFRGADVSAPLDQDTRSAEARQRNRRQGPSLPAQPENIPRNEPEPRRDEPVQDDSPDDDREPDEEDEHSEDD